MYNLLAQHEADRIKKILSLANLQEELNIEVLEGKYRVNASGVTESSQSGHFKEMNEFYLLDKDGTYGVLENENKFYSIFTNFGNWGYRTELDNAHITIGSKKFHNLCFQLELSQAFKDEDNIYIVKKIDKFAGNGSMVRLYRGLGKDRLKKGTKARKIYKRI